MVRLPPLLLLPPSPCGEEPLFTYVNKMLHGEPPWATQVQSVYFAAVDGISQEVNATRRLMSQSGMTDTRVWKLSFLRKNGFLGLKVWEKKMKSPILSLTLDWMIEFTVFLEHGKPYVQFFFHVRCWFPALPLIRALFAFLKMSSIS